MYNVSRLRTLIKNGWTIANRRATISKIGKANFDEIINLAHSANISDTFQYSNALTHLELSDIITSYKEYAECPYINDILRTGSALSENSQKIVNSLKLAISNNRLTGKFVRGISPTRANKLETIDDVSKFIFDNKGFTSVVPEMNADYANCFALGRNGVKVIFDVKNFPGYRANNYEVLFDTNAFTRDNFDIIQEGEKLFKIVEK